MIKVIITEDNHTIREGLAMLINATDGLECVAHYTNCEDMLENLERDRPDIYLQDIELPGMSGIEGVRQIKDRTPEAVILMLTIFDDNENIFEALKAGASGYLLKKTQPAQLITAIKEANSGGSPMSSEIARKVVSFFHQKSQSTVPANYALSKREREILTSLTEGKSYKLIAEKHFISIDTVRSHIRKIYRKMHVNNQTEAVSRAFRDGLV